MSTKNDPRHTVGTVVHSMAKSVRSDAECKRLFGNRLWNTTHLRGIVTDVGSVLTKSGRRNSVLWVNFDLPVTERALRRGSPNTMWNGTNTTRTILTVVVAI